MPPIITIYKDKTIEEERQLALLRPLLSFFVNERVTVDFLIYQNSLTPLDLTDYGIAFRLYDYEYTLQEEFTLDDGIEFMNETKGYVRINEFREMLRGDYYYQLVGIKDDDEEVMFDTGLIQIKDYPCLAPPPVPVT